MIDLEDYVTNLRLGIDEYSALRTLGVYNIRELLLLDVDRVLTLQGYNQIVRNRLAVWQKLLRKYLTYDKLHDARGREIPPEDDLNIHDPINDGDFESEDVEFLLRLNIVDFLALLDADPASDQYSDKEREQLTVLQDRYTIKAPPEAPKEAYTHYIPPRTVPPDQFLDEPIDETGLMEDEIDTLHDLHVGTVREFIELDLDHSVKDGDITEDTFTRLSSWQRYLKKKLHVV